MYEYQIIRSQRKTLALSLGRDGSLKVRAPRLVSKARIEEFVSAHADWIAKKKAALYEREAAYPNVLCADGEKIRLLGTEYEIRLCEGRGARLRGTVIEVDKAAPERALISFLKKTALGYLTERTEFFAVQRGMKYFSVSVGSARTRWGSCRRDGKIIYSYRLVFCPLEIIDYVIVHELCHTRQLNHSPAFWREVEAILPDYRLSRKALRNMGRLNEIL